jgi:hypothetical protein
MQVISKISHGGRLLLIRLAAQALHVPVGQLAQRSARDADTRQHPSRTAGIDRTRRGPP